MYDWAIELSKSGISEYPLGKYEEVGVLKWVKMETMWSNSIVLRKKGYGSI
jgi:hypothetical protein